MTVEIKDDLDLQKIAESGQCFRWEKTEALDNPVLYRIIAGGRVLFIEDRGECVFDLSCSENDYVSFWHDYLDLDTDYRKIRSYVKKDDGFLSRAAENGKGIRILRQDRWESLISFIISQRKNIPAIRASIEKLCRAAGRKITLADGEKKWLKERGVPDEYSEELYAFPDPEELYGLSEEGLKACSTGYRAPYLRRTAEDVLSGSMDLSYMESLNDDELLSELMKLYGVGKKVASCTALFGFHRLNFFPVDVWIERVLETHYIEGFPFESYDPWNGVMQQYMFYEMQHS